MDCENIVKFGILKYTDEVGILWIRYADYFIKLGLFERARDVFEEAINKVQTARDFGIVFNSYVKFEESMVEMLVENEQDEDELLLEKQLNKLLRIEDEMQ